MYALRSMARVPMNVFNLYGALPKQNPQFMNYWTCLGVMGFFIVGGRGAEKFAMWPSW